MDMDKLRVRNKPVSYKETSTTKKAVKKPEPVIKRISSVDKEKCGPSSGITKKWSTSSNTPSLNTGLSSTKSQSSTNSTPQSGEDSNSPTGQINLLELRIKAIEDKVAQYTNLASFETVILQLKEENIRLNSTIHQLKVDIEGVQLLCKRVNDENTELKGEITSLRSQISSIKQSQSTSSSSSDQGISDEQQQLNSNIVIRGVELSGISEFEPSVVYESIRSHLGVREDKAFDPVSVTVLPTTAAKSVTAKTIQVRLGSTAIKRQFLQVRRIKKNITAADIGLSQDSRKTILITEQLTRNN